MIYKAILSLCIGVAVTSTICGVVAWSIIKGTGLDFHWFWGIFAVAFALLIISSQVASTIASNSNRVTSAIEAAERSRYQTLKGVECYKCKSLNDVPIIISQSNEFVCASCSTKNRMLFATKTCEPNDPATTFNMDVEILQGNVG